MRPYFFTTSQDSTRNYQRNFAVNAEALSENSPRLVQLGNEDKDKDKNLGPKEGAGF